MAQSHHRIKGAVAVPQHLLMFSNNQHRHLVVPAAVATLQFRFLPQEGRVWRASKRRRPTRPFTRTTHYHNPQYPRIPLLHLSAQSPLSAASTQASRCSLQSQCGAQGMVATARKESQWPWRRCCSMGSGPHPQTMCHRLPLLTTVPAGLTRSEADTVHYNQSLLIPVIWHPRLHHFKMVPTVPSSHSEHHHQWTACPTLPVTVLENLKKSGEDW